MILKLWQWTAAGGCLWWMASAQAGSLTALTGAGAATQADGGSFSVLTLAVLAGLRRWRASRRRKHEITEPSLPDITAGPAKAMKQQGCNNAGNT